MLEMIYYVLTALVAILLLWNFVAKKQSFRDLIACVLVIMPLALRVFGIK